MSNPGNRVLSSRYRDARTLVRRVCRLPGEDRVQFKEKVARLREHFEQFNVDVSGLCQWFMGLRKAHAAADAANLATAPAGFGLLGDFLLEPDLDDVEADEAERDRWRLAVFDAVAGCRKLTALAGQAAPPALCAAIDAAARDGPHTNSRNVAMKRLFERLRTLDSAHRLVLLKSAAEWIIARYRRSVENWARQHEEWRKEKDAWESKHPELTPEVRERFTQVFRSLVWDKDKPPGVRNKKPRICPYERLKGNLDNCIYAGQKGHGPLCLKYDQFKETWNTPSRKFNDKGFEKDAAQFLAARKDGVRRHEVLKGIFRGKPADEQRFTSNLKAYLRALNLNEDTLVKHGRLPHCLRIGETFEKSKCEWNPHTELCKQYKRALDHSDNGFDEETLKLEPLYRDWRRNYLAGPRKPVFRYPSSRDLPMPKIFGAGFHEIDFDRSIVRLRLDGMPAGQGVEFGFTPWPRGYKPSRDEIKAAGRVTSVHVHFIGTRARLGFRFSVPPKASRFACSQDELDELRSRRFPRQAQDQEFLDAARRRLLDSFTGGPQAARRELRLLTVDLGENGARAAVYEGLTFKTDLPLTIVKIDRLYPALPDHREADAHGRPEDPKRTFDKNDPRGLRKEHVGRHLDRIAQKTAEITQHPRRRPPVPETVTPGDHDLRGLKRHTAWMIRDWVRLNAAQIVKAAEKHGCDLIVFESLRGFRPPGYDKLGLEPERKKRWLAMFAYGRVRRKVIEKAVERGMRVVTVPYFKSSQVCSECGAVQENTGRLRKNKEVRKFICEKKACAVELNSDLNAARVLARVFWGEVTLPSPDTKAVRRT